MLLLFIVANLVSSSGIAQPQPSPAAPAMGIALQPQAGANNGCTSQKLDGNTVARMNLSECQKKTAESTNSMLKRAHESAMATFNKEISKGPNSKDGGQCIEKVTQGTDRCMLADIIDVAVRKRKYNLAEKGNLTVLYDNEVPVAARVNVNYKIITIEVEPKKQKTIADLPAKRSMYFNKIGQLIAAEGDFTPDDEKDACKPCEPVKKTVETSSKKCNLGCQLRGTSALVSRGIQKKEVRQITKSDEKNKNEDDTNTSDENTEEPINEKDQEDEKQSNGLGNF